jgi:rhamnosyltransferase
MLRAGYAKVYEPRAGVLHSHEYAPRERFQRSFDEWRGLREVYGWREPVRPGHVINQLRGELGAARRELASAGVPRTRRAATLLDVARHHLARTVGAMLGSRADVLPAGVRRALSLERRAGFTQLDLDPSADHHPTHDQHA